MLKLRVSLFFRVDGPARYLSQLDFLRHFERATRRAGLPVRMSEGFNPRPRFSFPLARPVGCASRLELCEIELSRPVDLSHLTEALNAELTTGVRVIEAVYGSPREKRQIGGVRYFFRFRDPSAADCLSVDAFLNSETCHVQRKRTGKAIDVRRLVRTMDLEGDTLVAEVIVESSGSVRPEEILQAMGIALRDNAAKIDLSREVIVRKEQPRSNRWRRPRPRARDTGVRRR